MGMTELDRAFAAVRGSDRAEFVGRRDNRVVAAAEQALGLAFPPTYRRFITEFGAGAVGGQEFYGVIDDDFTNSGVPDGVWLTLRQRTQWSMPNHLVIVGDTGTGEFYVLDTATRSPDGESPVLVWFDGQSEQVAPDFGTFMWEMIQQELGLAY